MCGCGWLGSHPRHRSRAGQRYRMRVIHWCGRRLSWSQYGWRTDCLECLTSLTANNSPGGLALGGFDELVVEPVFLAAAHH